MPTDEHTIQENVMQFRRAVRDSIELFRTTGLPLRLATREFRFELERLVLADCNGNQCRAARFLGVHRNTFGRHYHEMQVTGRIEASKRYNARKLPRAAITPRARAATA